MMRAFGADRSASMMPLYVVVDSSLGGRCLDSWTAVGSYLALGISSGGRQLGKPRVLLADDHLLVVEAFKKLLEPEFEIVGIAPDGRSLLTLAQKVRPDVIVLDLGMPLLNGMDAGEQLKKMLPQTKLIVLTMSEDFD